MESVYEWSIVSDYNRIPSSLQVFSYFKVEGSNSHASYLSQPSQVVLVENNCIMQRKHGQRHNRPRVLSLWLELSFQLNWICIQFSCRLNSSFRLNTLGPLCLWQCLLDWFPIGNCEDPCWNICRLQIAGLALNQNVIFQTDKSSKLRSVIVWKSLLQGGRHFWHSAGLAEQ